MSDPLPGPDAPADFRFNLGHYRIEERIGMGAAAIVYRALDTKLERPVAVKILRDISSEKTWERFLREAKSAARLQHPNLVTVHEVGEIQERPYIVMEYIEGDTLDLNGPREQVIPALRNIALALHEAHQNGIVHRDIKPANVLVDSRGEPRVVDFGLAHVIDTQERLTLTGTPLGTPLYMAPEQVSARHDDIGPPTDVYALGIMLYEHLMHRTPYQGPTVSDVYQKILHVDPTPPSGPRDLVTICMKAIEKYSSQRYQTAAEFAEDLHRFMEGEPILARPPGLGVRLWKGVIRHRTALTGVGGVVLIGLVVLVAVLFPQWKEEREKREKAQRESADLQEKLKEEKRLAQEREAALRELGTLWTNISLAKQGFHNAANDPARVRKRIRDAIQKVGSYIRKHSGQPQGYYVRAKGLFYINAFDEAEANLKKAIECDPNFLPAYNLMGRIKIEQCAQSFDQWMEQRISPARRKKLLAEASKWLSQGHEDRSQEPWGLTETRDDRVAQTVMHALWQYYVDHDLPGAVKTLTAAHQSDPAAQYCLWLGGWTRDERERIKWQTEALKWMPHNPWALMERGVSRGRIGLRKEGFQDLQHAIRIDPDYWPAWYNLGYAFQRDGENHGAVRAYDNVLRIVPGHLLTLVNSAMAHHKLGHTEAALRNLTKAIEIRPEFSIAYYNRGNVLRRTGQIRKAVDDYTKCIQYEPRFVNAYLNRGIARRILKNQKGAFEDYNQALTIDPKHAKVYFNRGNWYRDHRKFDEAVRDYGRSIEFNPRYSWAYTNRARLLLLQGKLKDSLKDLDKGILLEPKYPDGWVLRAAVRQAIARKEPGRKGELLKRALQDIDQALKIAPRNWRYRSQAEKIRRGILKDRDNS